MTYKYSDTLVAIDASINSSLWYYRLGHISEKRMKVLLSKGRLPKLKSIEHNLCESYIFSKQKGLAFQNLKENQKRRNWS